MQTQLKNIAFAVVAFTALSANAQDDVIRKNLVNALKQGETIEKISELNRSGIFEVLTSQGSYYTNKTGSILLVEATAIDTSTKENLSEKFNFTELPLQNAVKVVRGNGSRKLITFEDPNCGYCRKLMNELIKLDNVTIYTFITPILGADSIEKSKSIWCSENQSKAWTDYMSNQVVNLEKKECQVPFKANTATFNRLRLKGTPAILFESNTKVPGYLNAEQIEFRLKKG